MPNQISNRVPKTPRSGRTVRLAYQGRSGARWTYSPTVVSSKPGLLEVSMLMPLLVGLLVEIEGGPRESTAVSEALSERVWAKVTGCYCSPDGLFRIRLAYSD